MDRRHRRSAYPGQGSVSEKQTARLPAAGAVGTQPFTGTKEASASGKQPVDARKTKATADPGRTNPQATEEGCASLSVPHLCRTKKHQRLRQLSQEKAKRRAVYQQGSCGKKTSSQELRVAATRSDIPDLQAASGEEAEW
jgi:hypothetical protein